MGRSKGPFLHFIFVVGHNCALTPILIRMTINAEAIKPTLDRLDDQIRWYGRKSGKNGMWYKLLKTVTLASGVLVPPLAVAEWGHPYAAALGIIIVLAEGMQQLN